MKKIFKFSLLPLAAAGLFFTGQFSSCKKSSSTTSADSGTFYFHLHTNIADTTIGGNTDGADSNSTGIGMVPWYFDGDTTGRRIQLLIPQFFVYNVMVINSAGNMIPIKNAYLLKGLDSEDYVVGKAPVGTYIGAMFTVGLDATTNATAPTTNFVTGGNPYPTESTMWYGATSMGYKGMYIVGNYDTSASHNGMNPIPFSFSLPVSLTTRYPVTLPNRGTGSYASFQPYLLTSGGIQYIHILCDYGKLLQVINLRTSNQTDGMTTNVPIADSLAANLPNMFRYEQ